MCIRDSGDPPRRQAPQPGGVRGRPCAPRPGVGRPPCRSRSGAVGAVRRGGHSCPVRGGAGRPRCRPGGRLMKLVFVTPRYGTEVIGGAETAARMVAERLCLRPDWEVEVLTSCALDHLTWENTEPAGTSVLNGVTVHRFPTASRRLLDYFELEPSSGWRRRPPRWPSPVVGWR